MRTLSMFPFTLRQLEVFDLVCRCNSFSKAAEELKVSQPAVSRQISALERQLGVDLFSRHPGNTASLTASGMRFRSDMEEFINAGRRLAENRRDKATSPPAKYHVYIASHLFEDVIRPQIWRLFESLKEIEVDFVPINPRIYSAHDFSNRKIDFGLYTSSNWTKERQVKGTEKIGDVSAAIYGHKKFLQKNMAQADLEKMPFILPPSGSVDEKFALEYLNELGFSPQNVVFRSSFHDVIREILGQGIAVSFALESMVTPFCKDVVSLWPVPPWTRIFYSSPKADQMVTKRVKGFFLECLQLVDDKPPRPPFAN